MAICFLSNHILVYPGIAGTDQGQTEIKNALAICRKITIPLLRLKCYDAIANNPIKPTEKRQAKQLKKKAGEPVKGGGKWQIQVKNNPIDDSLIIHLSLEAENEVVNYFMKTNPTLIIRCREKKTEMYIWFGPMIGGLYSARVKYRLDKHKPIRGRWGVSTDHKAIFISRPIRFIKKLMKHERLIVQANRFQGGPLVAIFNVSGLSMAIKPVQKACKWK
jgi:type VI secretion system protein VasI